MMPGAKDTRNGPRSRPDRTTITLAADVVDHFTNVAHAQGRGRYEVMNEALRKVMPERKITTTEPRPSPGVLAVIVLDQTVLVDVDGTETDRELARRLAKTINGAKARLAAMTRTE